MQYIGTSGENCEFLASTVPVTTPEPTTLATCTPTDSCDGHYDCDNATLETICHPGYEGDLCQDRIDPGGINDPECPGNGFQRCSNGGTCWDGQCCCPPGYSGISCTKDIDECESDPCQNGGTCFTPPNTANTYECFCTEGENVLF